jgi:hypothetical protein
MGQRLLQELLRARAREANCWPGQQQRAGEEAEAHSAELDDHLAQLALDTAEWLKTLWDVGYMGAGNFRSQPRSAFPSIDLEDIRKSSLFARIRQGKHALPFAPPTRQGLPWHELLEGRADKPMRLTPRSFAMKSNLPIGAIIEGCAEWHVIEEDAGRSGIRRAASGEGAAYRLRLTEWRDATARLHREPPSMTRKIHLQGRGGFHSYTLEWPKPTAASSSCPCAQRPGSVPNRRPSIGWRHASRTVRTVRFEREVCEQ